MNQLGELIFSKFTINLIKILQDLKKQTEYTKGRHFFRFNNDEHIVRLHIGLEDPKDLISDLKTSLGYIK